MRFARPWRLRGQWGAWVTGEGVEPDMLMSVHTRNGKSWFSKVENVLEQRASGAICERIDISVEGDLNLEIPFLSYVKPDSLFLGWIWDWVEEVNGPAPEIGKYEYYRDFERDHELYESRALGTIQELDREIETWLRAKSNQWAEATLNGPETSVSDSDIQIDFREEEIRRQRERIPRQIANLRDYSRLGGPDSAWN